MAGHHRRRGHLAPASRARADHRRQDGVAGALLPANLERAVHQVGAVIAAGVAVAIAGVVVARVESRVAVKFGTAVGESLAGGDQLQAQVARVENQEVVKFGTVDGESLAGGDQLQAQVARVENRAAVIVDGAVAAVDGVHLENLERARGRKKERARKQNLARARDIGVG